MSNCKVMVSGQVGEYELVSENKNTVWIRLPENKRTVVRKTQVPVRDYLIEAGYDASSIPITDKTIGIPENVEIDGREIIKRHKVKHNFERV